MKLKNIMAAIAIAISVLVICINMQIIIKIKREIKKLHETQI